MKSLELSEQHLQAWFRERERERERGREGGREREREREEERQKREGGGRKILDGTNRQREELTKASARHTKVMRNGST